MSKGRLYFTVGLSRSGKSSWVKKWGEYSIETFIDPLPGDAITCYPRKSRDYLDHDDRILPNFKRVVVSGDSFRRALHGSDFRIEAESTVYANMDIATRAHLMDGYDVMVDETCTTEQTLLRYLRLDINARPIFFDTPEEECIKRAIDTGKPHLIGPIKRMARQLKELRKDWDGTVARLKEYLLERQQHDVAV